MPDLALVAPAPYGRRAATSSSASPSACSSLRSRSTTNRRPGWRRPRRTTFAGSTGSTPASEPSTTQALVGDQPAAGAQAVAVEAGAEHAAVGEDHRRRAVPGLDHRGAVAVEAVELVRHVVAVLVGGRDHHHHRLGQRAGRRATSSSSTRSKAAESELPSGISGRQRSRSSPNSVRVQRGLAGAHPVDVAGEGVDLAVVGEQPQRLRQLPAREGVGREARVDDRERALQLRVAQVGVEARRAAARVSIPL